MKVNINGIRHCNIRNVRIDHVNQMGVPVGGVSRLLNYWTIPASGFTKTIPPQGFLFLSLGWQSSSQSIFRHRLTGCEYYADRDNIQDITGLIDAQPYSTRHIINTNIRYYSTPTHPNMHKHTQMLAVQFKRCGHFYFKCYT